MGRPKRYRERLEFEMGSVRAKGVSSHLVCILQAEFGRSRIEAEVLAERSLGWLRGLGVSQLPGQVWLSVPAAASKRHAQKNRRLVLVTAVDVGEDTAVWQTFGLAALQRHRLLRWLGEIRRQGGWASLKELAAWANLTPTALGARLEPMRELGVRLPHVGESAPGGALEPEAWLVDRYLAGDRIEPLRTVFGLTLGRWETILQRLVSCRQLTDAGASPEEVAQRVGRSVCEVEQLLAVAFRHRRKKRFLELQASYGVMDRAVTAEAAIEAALLREHHFSPVEARLYHEVLRELAVRLGLRRLPEGRLVFFAIRAGQGARVRLHEAEHVPVILSYFGDEDAERGPRSSSPTRVAALKFGRILRYSTEARAQGGLLTLPDLSVLLGIHVDAIRRQIAQHPEVVVPTRGRIMDIGRGVSHKRQIVELYLQMHTETEICERTGHSYESVEAYLREFARVVTLADRGMNAVMIRRVLGRSMALVEAYLALYRQYEQPEHHFRLAQLRRVFAREQDEGQKGGSRLRCRTWGGEL